MTLPRLPDDVEAARNRVTLPLEYPFTDLAGQHLGAVEITPITNSAGEKDVYIRWFRSSTDPNYYAEFNRSSDLTLYPQFAAVRDLVNQRIADATAMKTWNRSDAYISPYTATPRVPLPDFGTWSIGPDHQEVYTPGSGLNVREEEIHSKTANTKRRGGAGRGSTIITGGLGVYQQPETNKRKLGSK